MDTIKEHLSPELIMNDRQTQVECIRRWGGTTTDAILDPSCKIFTLPDVDGLIGYRAEFGHAVVFGDPVGSPCDKIKLALAFQEFCQSKNYKVIYLIVSEDFAQWAIKNICKVSLEFGEKFYLDPQHNPYDKTGTKGSLVRRKVKRAVKENVVVTEYLTHQPELEHEMINVGVKWLKSRKGPQIHISNVRLFDDTYGKRWFYATQGSQFVGLVVLNQLQAHDGWLLNHLMITPEATNGTPEILVVSAIEALQKEGCKFVTFGSVPGDSLGKITGMGAISSWIAHKGYSIANKIFHLEGNRMFWEKFQPQSEASYLLFSEKITINGIRSLMKALNVSVT